MKFDLVKEKEDWDCTYTWDSYRPMLWYHLVFVYHANQPRAACNDHWALLPSLQGQGSQIVQTRNEAKLLKSYQYCNSCTPHKRNLSGMETDATCFFFFVRKPPEFMALQPKSLTWWDWSRSTKLFPQLTAGFNNCCLFTSYLKFKSINFI